MGHLKTPTQWPISSKKSAPFSPYQAIPPCRGQVFKYTSLLGAIQTVTIEFILSVLDLCLYVCMHTLCMHVCVYVSVYLYIYVCMYLSSINHYQLSSYHVYIYFTHHLYQFSVYEVVVLSHSIMLMRQSCLRESSWPLTWICKVTLYPSYFDGHDNYCYDCLELSWSTLDISMHVTSGILLVS